MPDVLVPALFARAKAWFARSMREARVHPEGPCYGYMLLWMNLVVALIVLVFVLQSLIVFGRFADEVLAAVSGVLIDFLISKIH